MSNAYTQSYSIIECEYYSHQSNSNTEPSISPILIPKNTLGSSRDQSQNFKSTPLKSSICNTSNVTIINDLQQSTIQLESLQNSSSLKSQQNEVTVESLEKCGGQKRLSFNSIQPQFQKKRPWCYISIQAQNLSSNYQEKNNLNQAVIKSINSITQCQKEKDKVIQPIEQQVAIEQEVTEQMGEKNSYHSANELNTKIIDRTKTKSFRRKREKLEKMSSLLPLYIINEENIEEEQSQIHLSNNNNGSSNNNPKKVSLDATKMSSNQSQPEENANLNRNKLKKWMNSNIVTHTSSNNKQIQYINTLKDKAPKIFNSFDVMNKLRNKILYLQEQKSIFYQRRYSNSQGTDDNLLISKLCQLTQ